MPVPRHNYLLSTGIAVILLVFAGLLIFLSSGQPSGPIATALLADGRIIQIEALTYGTEHRVGHSAPIYDRFAQWLPGPLRGLFAPARPETRLHLDQPALVVWVNMVDASTGKPVDCQRIRSEFVDGNGDLFGPENYFWYGISTNFWRAGHSFTAFPRDSAKLTLQVTTLGKKKGTTRLDFANPFVTAPAIWSGGPLPQQKNTGTLEIRLAALDLRTNGGPKKYWETPARYWEPRWELRTDNKPVAGWSDVEWIADDPLGNRGQSLGMHEPVLRFTATVYPEATNANEAVLVASLPQVILSNATTTNITWWNSNYLAGSNAITALGWFPKNPMCYIFSDGHFATNPPVSLAPTRGGAPSGWVGQSQRTSPLHVQYWQGHYSQGPVIYLRVGAPGTDLNGSATHLDFGSRDPVNRLAIRLRDDLGRVWVAKPEPEGAADGIMAYLIDLPSEVRTVTPEIVLLKPARAEFMVDMSAGRAQ